MSEQKYRVGQEVEFFPERGVEHAAKSPFIVVRLFLGERNTSCYRIKHEVDGHERMVGESERPRPSARSERRRRDNGNRRQALAEAVFGREPRIARELTKTDQVGGIPGPPGARSIISHRKRREMDSDF